MEQLLEQHMLGFHASIQGGIDQAPERIKELDCPTGQIFTTSNRQWKIRPFHEGEVDAFKRNAGELSGPVVAHASYLINLAKPDDEKRQQSIDSLVEEIRRCDELGIPDLVLHPGSHVGSGVENGMETIVESLDEMLSRTSDCETRITPESMAGQGSVLPYTLEQLGRFRDQSNHPERISFCLDTCHMHASGMDLTTRSGYESVMETVDSKLGSDNVTILHFNDSRGELGCRKDRHADIGTGSMGKDPFTYFLEDNRWNGVPKILETPVEDDWRTDYQRNLETLVSLAPDS